MPRRPQQAQQAAMPSWRSMPRPAPRPRQWGAASQRRCHPATRCDCSRSSKSSVTRSYLSLHSSNIAAATLCTLLESNSSCKPYSAWHGTTVYLQAQPTCKLLDKIKLPKTANCIPPQCKPTIQGSPAGSTMYMLIADSWHEQRHAVWECRSSRALATPHPALRAHAQAPHGLPL